MRVDVSRHYELYDEDAKRVLGKDAPIGFPAMAIVAIVASIFFTVVLILKSSEGIDVLMVIFYLIVVSLWVLSIYLVYDVFGNYLYYKGIWRDPPFAKRSVKVFWRDLKKGKLPYMLLWEVESDATKYHFIYRGLGNRGVVVEISKEEKLELDKFLEDRVERGAKRVRFEYNGTRVKGAVIEYRDGSEEKVDRERAELMRFFYLLSKHSIYSALKSSKIMGKLTDE